MSAPSRLLLAILALANGAAEAEVLYETDFEEFPVGQNAWAGFDGWISNDTTSGVQSIDQDVIADGGLGKTAALGFNSPNNVFTTVLQTINYDPAVSGNPILEVQALFGIEDSTEFTNFRRDDFFFSFYNIDGDLLASIRISNTDLDYGFWRRDGSLQEGGTETDTGQEFIHSELHNFNARINLETNRWTATVDGITLFQDEVFNGTGLPRTLGLLGVEWQIAQGNAAAYGDNWMLLADLRIETVKIDPPTLQFDSVLQNESGQTVLQWQAGPGFDYQVEYSSDLETWFDNLPNSYLPTPLVLETFQFTDPSAAGEGRRYYRLRRTSRY